MNPIQKITKKIDGYQRARLVPGFIYAVVKKYGDDRAGYQAALLTYYGFLSLFPLLLVITTILSVVARNNDGLRQTIITSINDYFPVLGNQLSNSIDTPQRTGLALVIGLLFAIYGTRGVADAFRHGVNHIWGIPEREQVGFPTSIIKSLILILVAGIGLVGASVIAGFAAAAGHGIIFRVLSLIFNVGILFGLFIIMLKLCLPRKVTVKEVYLGGIVAALGLVLLQVVGGVILTRELRNLDALYSTFALALGLLFWIYLQAQVLYYAVVAANVKTLRLWPRSLTGDQLTKADKAAYTQRTEATEKVEEQEIKSTFR